MRKKLKELAVWFDTSDKAKQLAGLLQLMTGASAACYMYFPKFQNYFLGSFIFAFGLLLFFTVVLC